MITKLKTIFNDKLFNSIHSNNLVYNTCWEDPRIDRKLLNLNSKSSVVMITSAGCNALDYLLDNPKEINAVDINQRQNSLLNLKKACFLADDYVLLFQLFGEGKINDPHTILKKQLKEYLTKEDYKYWNEKIKYFKSDKVNNSFYYRGTSGKFAKVFNQYLNSKPKLRELVEDLFESDNLNKQTKAFKKINHIFDNVILEWLLKRHITLALLGIPTNQYKLIIKDFPLGLMQYLKEKFDHLFTELPIKDNYFWRVYLYGAYSQSCKPNYLSEDNFNFLKSNISKITTHTNTIAGFLEENPNKYSHFVLLDHQDWLAINRPDELIREWELILKNSSKGTKILLRSASFNRGFLPNFILDKIEFLDDEVDKYHPNDRVGTYGSTHLAIVK
jgi:S-adenosylmethionine-diacylglycerol 3-amino-3-carboxypropyl transferase